MDLRQPITHIDDTATQGFEPSGDSIVEVWPEDCSKCMRPFREKGGLIKVYTAHGIKYWCLVCSNTGVKNNICLKYNGLNNKQKKMLEKYESSKSNK